MMSDSIHTMSDSAFFEKNRKTPRLLENSSRIHEDIDSGY